MGCELSKPIGVLFVTILASLLFCSSAFAWGPVTHAHIAEDVIRNAEHKIWEINNRYGTGFELDYKAYLAGSIAPDMEWAFSDEFGNEYHTIGYANRLYENSVKNQSQEAISFALGWLTHVVSDKDFKEESKSRNNVNLNEGICLRTDCDALTMNVYGANTREIWPVLDSNKNIEPLVKSSLNSSVSVNVEDAAWDYDAVVAGILLCVATRSLNIEDVLSYNIERYGSSYKYFDIIPIGCDYWHDIPIPQFSPVECENWASDDIENGGEGVHSAYNHYLISSITASGFAIASLPSCFSHCCNRVQDADEEGVDCGGSCKPCEPNPMCDEGTTGTTVCSGSDVMMEYRLSDCTTTWMKWYECPGGCENGRCTPGNDPTCDDGLKNSDEDGVDCGGSCPEPCEEAGCPDICNPSWPETYRWYDGMPRLPTGLCPLNHNRVIGDCCYLQERCASESYCSEGSCITDREPPGSCSYFNYFHCVPDDTFSVDPDSGCYGAEASGSGSAHGGSYDGAPKDYCENEPGSPGFNPQVATICYYISHYFDRLCDGHGVFSYLCGFECYDQTRYQCCGALNLCDKSKNQSCCNIGTDYSHGTTNSIFGCIDLNSNEEHCGSCGHECLEGEVCIDADCVPEDRCSDGTAYGECSSTKPLRCDNGLLIPDCTACGCPDSFACQKGKCVGTYSCIALYLPVCATDGKTYGNGCYADLVGAIVACDGECPCGDNQCSDSTPCGWCSGEKPKRCENKTLVDSCDKCECPTGYECQGDGSCTASLCSDGTLHGECSSALTGGTCGGSLYDSCNDATTEAECGNAYIYYATDDKHIQCGWNSEFSFCQWAGECNIGSPSNLYCYDGGLIENCSACGCSEGERCQSNGICRPASDFPAGDITGDCLVNIFDLSIVGLCYGQVADGSCEPADLNGDSAINILDLATVGLNYGSTC